MEKPKINRELIDETNKIHHQMPRWMVLLIIAGIFIFFAYRAASLLVILLLSCVLAYIVSNVVNKTESTGIKRHLAVMMLYFFMVILLFGAEMILSPYLQREVENFYAGLPGFSARIENALTVSTAGSTSNYPLSDELIRKILKAMIGPGLLIDKMFNFPEAVNKTTSVFFGGVFIPFFAFFLLRDWPKILKKVMAWTPPEYVETTVSLLSEMNILIGKYLRGLTLESILVGLITAVGLWILGINYPISLGILTGVINVIPYFGPFAACSAACLIALLQFNSAVAVLNVVFLFIVIRLIDDLAIQHFTIGRIIDLHPMLLVISIMSGYMLFGLTGMVVSVPVVSIIQKALSILIKDRKHLADNNEPIHTVNIPV